MATKVRTHLIDVYHIKLFLIRSSDVETNFVHNTRNLKNWLLYISVYILWVQRMFNVFVPTFIVITITIFTTNSVAFISLERSLWGNFFYLKRNIN